MLSALVFSELPSIFPFFGHPRYRPAHVERAEIAHKSNKIWFFELEDTKVRRALAHNIPTLDRSTYQSCSIVHVWREKSSSGNSREWTETHTVKLVDLKSCIPVIKDARTSEQKQLSNLQMKPFVCSETKRENFYVKLYTCFLA